MKKKVLAMLLGWGLVMTGLAGCGGSGEGSSENSRPESTDSAEKSEESSQSSESGSDNEQADSERPTVSFVFTKGETPDVHFPE